MTFMPTQQRAGPVVWSGIIAATCALLFLLQQMLFLAIPFLFGIVLYYIMQPPMQRLIRAGVRVNAAILTVGSAFLLVLLIVIVIAMQWDSGPSEPWQDMLGRCITGGREFVRQTML